MTGPDALAPLFEPVSLGSALHLRNRIVLAPCTRNRATADLSPTPGAVGHYASRAAAGLLVTEATIIARHVQGYVDTPGIFLDTHVQAWAAVAEAVHAEGGLIACQLWHPGRMAHSHYAGVPPLAPSSVLDPAARRQTRGLQLYHEAPVAMTEAQVIEAIAAYGAAARRARDAGFDAVEIHGANGYLPEQFLRLHTNRRTDSWGGSPENRARFAIAVVDACAEGMGGAGRVGLRLSPAAYFSEMRWTEGDNEAFLALADALRSRPLAYVHTGIIEDEPVDYLGSTSSQWLRTHFSGPLMGNGGYDAAGAAAAIRAGTFDAIAFGRLFLANPDLVDRLRRGLPLAAYSRALLDDFT